MKDLCAYLVENKIIHIIHMHKRWTPDDDDDDDNSNISQKFALGQYRNFRINTHTHHIRTSPLASAAFANI